MLTEKVFTFVKSVGHSLMTIDNFIYAASKQCPGIAFSSNDDLHGLGRESYRAKRDLWSTATGINLWLETAVNCR